jgi:uncharacterized membrane protein YdfJ with MMPL/SSD domain
MTRLEEQLKQALARQDPPEDFHARVLARVEEQRVRSSRGIWRWWARWAHSWPLAPALAALLVLSAGAIYQEHQRIARGEAAKEKLLVAMRVAGAKLHEARDRVSKVEATEVQRWDKTYQAY